MIGHGPIEWNDSFATGVREIDEQHRILVNTLNEANAKLTDDVSIDFVEQITQDLLSYALYHFETEEELMQEYGYADACGEDSDRHLQQHRSFSSKVVAVRDNLRAGIPIGRDDLIGFLNNWLVNHILHTDKKLGAYILAKRGAAA
ncbi:bacteriohemerythrin [Parasulfuritortus cantonensis]|uniref:Bacteriohemerythrin n=1 Tax=Parasulfuritortus cantonensis TaxID=2528202 RepID=A0A4R1BAE2_9PROT|nr:bacteriohemerythrin [Parasulfuritortus cantonensis]TCJ13925.1 bacteriohemerythrin [Parasulfuritortus cantonensis]